MALVTTILADVHVCPPVGSFGYHRPTLINIREDIDLVTEAKAYERLISALGVTQMEVATRIGKSHSYIANRRRLLSLPKGIVESLTRVKLTATHAIQLLRLPVPCAQRQRWLPMAHRTKITPAMLANLKKSSEFFKKRG